MWPPVGGWLIDGVGWRSIFLLNLPLALGSIALAWAFVHDPEDQRHSTLDISGAFLAMASLGAVTWGTNLYWASNDSALLTGAWWTFVPAGLCVALLGFALTLVSFALDAVT